MLKYIGFIFLLGLLGCAKEEAVSISKARTLWGDWDVEETKIIFDDLKGIRLSTTVSNFDISFYHTNEGRVSGLNYEDFIWAIQDDPDVLIISPELFSVDSLGELHFNTTELFYFSKFSDSNITLHHEFTSIINSIKSTTEKFWILTPK